MEMTYTRAGDYLIPDIRLSSQETKPIGKYGQMRKQYLKEHRPILWNRLILKEQLFPHLQEMLKLLRRANANINQIAKHLHETGRVYDTDLEEILGYQKEIYKGQNELLTRLVKLQ